MADQFSSVQSLLREIATPGYTFALNSAATTNATLVKAGSTVVTAISAFNANAAARYLKIYNKATAPTVGTDRPVLVVSLPANTGVHLSVSHNLSLGLGIALVTGAADSDATAVAANEIKVTITYR